MPSKFLYPFWGSEHLCPNDFFEILISKGFDGIEINIPIDPIFETTFYDVLNTVRKKNPDFVVVLQQVVGKQKETPESYLKTVMNRLESLIHHQPNFINSHTGRDYFSFEDNCRIIRAIESFSETNNIPVYHEIHRGRFTFHTSTTLQYLEKFPNLKFVGDLSHWCVVSESMLQDQEEIINKIIPKIYHIHARIGFEQAPQVNNPFAPEWHAYLNQFTQWWQSIIDYHQPCRTITITPEFGPFPYMPQAPFTKLPLANQHNLNFEMKAYLKSHLK
ncbi:sugar phosphate isomerase/epimerase [Paucihalobacter ruber]|uniref:Sugar phosphate isomerase/epimerase n=1 Tax=Paucihalobacter ruber TaxID=2567861 RepID=A0A506PP91_9FLAO|nr:sugar phosphate isomerase/epimerase [Paucihalobacter ruber]TPV35359.1 sugar phosphate isomerase/epimerase [Paucihalobacter ruber]